MNTKNGMERVKSIIHVALITPSKLCVAAAHVGVCPRGIEQAFDDNHLSVSGGPLHTYPQTDAYIHTNWHTHTHTPSLSLSLSLSTPNCFITTSITIPRSCNMTITTTTFFSLLAYPILKKVIGVGSFWYVF